MAIMDVGETIAWVVRHTLRTCLRGMALAGTAVAWLPLFVISLVCVVLLPTGVRAWIEDVVVDEEARGAGVAGALVQAALERAEQEGARTVDLTSRPDREAANRLYLRLGFERRETNVYRISLD